MKKRQVRIGGLTVGGGFPIAVQTMADRKTADLDSVVPECLEAIAAGADIIRFSVLDQADADAFKLLKKLLSVPLVADIHFDYRLALAALEAGADKIRINPGNLPPAHLKTVADCALEHRAAVRIGLNLGSAGTRDFASLFERLDSYISALEERGLFDIVLSLKSSSPDEALKLYREADRRYDYPLHLGLTEAGYGEEALMKSAALLVPLLKDGIGDTLRISLADSPVREVRAARYLLKALGLLSGVPTLVCCPTCGRTTVDVKRVARRLDEHLVSVRKDVKIAVMGCPVNGPGEAKDADIGLSGADGRFLVFAKGKPLFWAAEDEAVAYVLDYIDRL